MEKKKFVKYDVPKVVVIEVEVEKGFAVSGDGDVETNGMGGFN